MHIIRASEGSVTEGPNCITFFGPKSDWIKEGGIEVNGETGLAVLSGIGGSRLSCYSGCNGMRLLEVDETRVNDFTR